jgi:hypothetical protein
MARRTDHDTWRQGATLPPRARGAPAKLTWARVTSPFANNNILASTHTTMPRAPQPSDPGYVLPQPTVPIIGTKRSASDRADEDDGERGDKAKVRCCCLLLLLALPAH